MAQNSRGGGYDLAEAKTQEKKKALGTETRQSVGAQAVARSPGAAMEAPTSIGQLMTPSVNATPSRLDPNDETFNRQVEKNRSFLSNPETKAQLMQFAVSMMAGNMPGEALAKAIALPGRAAAADAKLAKAQADADRSDAHLQIALERLGMDKDKLAETEKEKEQRKATFGALKVMSDEKLMQAAQEMAMNGDEEGARIALSMMKTGANNDALTAEIKEYKFDVDQGYKGSMMEWREAKFKTSAIETIRKKIAIGEPLLPGEQKLYNDTLSESAMTNLLMSDPKFAEIMKGIGSDTGGIPTQTPPVPTASPVEGTSGNVTFKVIENK
jgi:hypothetical protein